MSKVLLVVDVSNLYYCVKSRLGGKINYVRLLERVKDYGQICRAIAYGSYLEDEAAPFIDFLQNHGYEAKYKQCKIQTNRRKADWDVGITIDIVRMVNLVDVVVIASADGDLAETTKWIQERGRKVVVIGAGISGDLKSVANEFIELDWERNHDLVVKELGVEKSVDIVNKSDNLSTAGA